MIAPYVLVEGREVTLFTSLDELTNWVEPQDVREGIYDAFDSEGRVVTLTATSDNGPVTAEAGKSDGDRFRRLLIHHIEAVGPARIGITERDLATADLAWIVRAVWGFHRGGRSSSW